MGSRPKNRGQQPCSIYSLSDQPSGLRRGLHLGDRRQGAAGPMHPEPSSKPALAFIDSQNLFYAAKYALG
jgi:hypothetical protein